MKKQTPSTDLTTLSPSPFVQRFGDRLVSAAAGRPILDLGCGGARNSVFIAYLGGSVIGIDIDLVWAKTNLKKLKGTVFWDSLDRITLLQHDLISGGWPISAKSAGGIVSVHFLHEPLLQRCAEALLPGGIFLLETVEGRGGNYLELPQANHIRNAIGAAFSMISYRERPVGPAGVDAVTLKMAAVRL